MVHTTNENGQIFIDKQKKLPKNALKIFRETESNNIIMNLQHMQNKLKKELNTFQMLNELDSKNNNNKNEILSMNNQKMVFKKDKYQRWIWNNNNKNKKNNKNIRHTIYLDNQNQRNCFDASQYFNTPKCLLNNVHNRYFLCFGNCINMQLMTKYDEIYCVYIQLFIVCMYCVFFVFGKLYIYIF